MGKNEQSLPGWPFAGRQVLVQEQKPGVWLIGTASAIADNERWLDEPRAASGALK